MGDIFPVVFHNGTVEPATNASKAFFSGEKSDLVSNSVSGETTATESNSQSTQTTPNGYKIGKRDDPTTWEAFVPTPLTKAECEELIGEEYGIKACNFNTDYWAAAVKECGGVQNMLKRDDLDKLAETMYSSCNSNYSCTGYNSSKVPENLSGLGASWYTLWSGSGGSFYGASGRAFYSSGSTRYGSSRNSSDFRAVCVGD